MRRSLSIACLRLLLLFGPCLAVVPVWKTPVAERRFAPPLKRSSAPYYTRPEDFQIPSYQPPRSNQPPVVHLPITPPGFRPNYNLYPRPQTQQQGPPFPPPQYPQQRPYYPQAYQPRPPPQGRYPNGWIYWNGAIVPPEAIPYLSGAGPIPPQGAYGPGPTTKAAEIPAVRPDTFTGKIPMAPSAQPETPKTTISVETSPYAAAEETTTATRTTETARTSTEQTTARRTSAEEMRTKTTSKRPETTEEMSTIGTLFTMRKNPFILEETTTTTRKMESRTEKEEEEGYEFRTEATKASPSPPAATPPQVTAPTNLAPPSGTDYFPRPVVAQAFQPPKKAENETGQEIVEKLDVKILQPAHCAGALCFDKNKVSVYTPQTGAKLLISNAAKGDRDSLPRPSVPEQKYLPYAPSYGGPPPRPIEHPRGPHVFIPPNAFSMPPSEREEPTPPTEQPKPFSATARTIPPTEGEYEASPPSVAPPLPPSVTPEQPNIVPIVPNYGGFPPKEERPPPLTLLPPPPSSFPPTLVPPSEEVTEQTTEYIPFVPTTEESTLPPWATPTEQTIPGSFSPTYKPLYPETTPERPTPPTTSVTPQTTSFPRTPLPSGPHPTLVPEKPSTEMALPSFPTAPPSFFSSTPQTPPVFVRTESVPPQTESFTPPSLQTFPPSIHSSPPPSEIPLFPTSSPPEIPVFPPSRTLPPQTPSVPSPSTVTRSPSASSARPPTHFFPETPVPGTPPTPFLPSRSPPSAPTLPAQTVPPFASTAPPTPSERTSSPPRETPPPSRETTSPSLRTSSPRPLSTSTPYFVSQTTPTTFYQPTTTKKGVQNRLRAGKVRVICQEEGIKFVATSILPFSGEIFASDRKRIPVCHHSFENVVMPMAFLPFKECGVKNAGEQVNNQTQYHIQVVVVVKQQDGSTTVQSYMAQCVHQKIHYDKQSLPRRIEEALEELRLVPTKLEQKALLPLVDMKLLVDEHGRLGPEVAAVDIGMPLALQWKLTNESIAYGFHVKNCAVADMITGMEMFVVDEQGCSTDTTILGHPHYDTYHDSASSHMWAFKVPDHTLLRLSCEVSICTDIPADSTNQSNCNSIPTPPFCPDLITSPANSILFDASGNFLKRRREIDRAEETQTVRAAICTSANCRLDYVPLPHCVDTRWLAVSSAFSISLLALSVLVNLALRWKVAHEKELIQSGRF